MKHSFAILILLGIMQASSAEEDLIKDLKQSLMAPCCWSGTVYDHGHPETEKQIEEFVREGRTKDEITNYFVSLYGERILAIPVASGFNLFVWIAPLLIAGIGVLIFILYLRTSKQAPAPVELSTPDIQFDSQIEKELKELD